MTPFGGESPIKQATCRVWPATRHLAAAFGARGASNGFADRVVAGKPWFQSPTSERLEPGHLSQGEQVLHTQRFRTSFDTSRCHARAPPRDVDRVRAHEASFSARRSRARIHFSDGVGE
jgi:hypothetical protein